jgi:Domain of unknown function (DUF4034)
MKRSFKIVMLKRNLLLSLMLVAGLSKTSAQNNGLPPQSQQPVFANSEYMHINGKPVKISVVDTKEKQERQKLRAKIIALLEAKDYDKLDEIADGLRASKASWSTGHWKLANFYAGLETSNKPPDVSWETRIAALQDWVTARPQSINARVALAYSLVGYAWDARGSGWADTVTEEGWRLMGERLNQATKVLDDAGELKAHCPVAWSVRMKVGLGLGMGKTEFKALFDDALRTNPDYSAYYYRRAMYLLPRWFGEPGEWESDLAKSADKIGGKEGDVLYAQVVWCIYETIGAGDFFSANGLSWPRVNRGFDGIEMNFPDSLEVISAHAILAVLAADKQQARKCLNQTAGQVDLAAWRTKQYYIDCVKWVNMQ